MMNQRGFIPLIIAIAGIVVISIGSTILYNKFKDEKLPQLSESEQNYSEAVVNSSMPVPSPSVIPTIKPIPSIVPTIKPTLKPTSTPTPTPSPSPSPTPFPTRWPMPQNFRVSGISCSGGQMSVNLAWDVPFSYPGFRVYFRNPNGGSWLYDKFVQLSENRYTYVFPDSERWNVRVATTDPNRDNPGETESNLTAEIALSKDLCN